MRRRLLAVLVAGACAGAPAEKPAPVVAAVRLRPSGPPLPPPVPVDAGVRGASYLTAVAGHVQPAWGQFLEDCRLRLPATHPLNDRALHATVELVVQRDGKIADVTIVRGSGNGDFDTAVFDVLGDASPLPPPPAALASDDDRVHVQWLFARDRRQAGPATAQIVDHVLPVLGVVERWLAADQLPRAARRVASAAPSDPERVLAGERIMVAALREALATGNGAARRAALEAIGRTRAHPLAREVRQLAPQASDPDLQLAALGALAAVGDGGLADRLLASLPPDLAGAAEIARAKTAALVAVGRSRDAARLIEHALGAPVPSTAALVAFGALGTPPSAALARRMTRWFTTGDARLRAAVCRAHPAPAILERGLRDADATVRATCVELVGLRASPAVVRRVRELVRDRDRVVRARAVTALGLVAPSSEAELRALTRDGDPDVRAAAVAALGDHAPELVRAAAADIAYQVRRAAVTHLSDDELLERLTRDDSPEVASAALVRLATRRGRVALARPLFERLAAAPAASEERVRIALAWLLAR